MSNIWFYAGLFHDIGSCIEKSQTVNKFYRGLIEIFSDISLPLPAIKAFSKKRIIEQVERLFHVIGSPLREGIEPLFKKSLKDNQPDHGVMAALHLLNVVNDIQQRFYTREAARSIALHNIVGKTEAKVRGNLSWETEPVGCLLLLCDQIQTWDRERSHDDVYGDEPKRAELLNLIINKENGQVVVQMFIDYVAPPQIIRMPEIYTQVKNNLEYVLQDKPARALNKIKKPWPFKLKLYYSISRDPILELPF